jgi:hypothetical protein
MKSHLVHKSGGQPKGDGRPHLHPRGTVAVPARVHKASEPNKKVGEGPVNPSQKGQNLGVRSDS